MIYVVTRLSMKALAGVAFAGVILGIVVASVPPPEKTPAPEPGTSQATLSAADGVLVAYTTGAHSLVVCNTAGQDTRPAAVWNAGTPHQNPANRAEPRPDQVGGCTRFPVTTDDSGTISFRATGATAAGPWRTVGY